uniref:Lipase n=2 Tax=Lygus hesperus TaxID=30085 RepID=A0A146LAH3_LYGHE
MWLLSVAAIFLPTVALAQFDWINPPDTAEQIRSHGYPVESHFVTTADGYVLKLFRIPRGKKMTPTSKPLLLQHGLLCSSDCWTLSGPDHGLAFILADRGYDVWLGNNRGTTYSMSHMSIPSDDPKLWDFGIHEMGVYDLPAMIDYILETTNEDRISYVGHSQGTTIFYIMASMLPEYQSKVLVASSMAPVAFLDNTRGAISTLSILSSILVWLARSVGYSNILHNTLFTRGAGEIVCQDDFILGNMCKTVMFQLAGADNHLTNDTLAPLVTRHCPAGASIKQLQHFIQLTQNGGHFTQFDYGPVDNMVKYGSLTPPHYPLDKITTPMLLYYSDNDNIATEPEVLRLAKSVKNVRSLYAIKYKDFNHLDFMWAINATALLFNPAINDMTTFR